MTLVNAKKKKKALTLKKKSTKSTSAHQKKASHRKKGQEKTMVLLKALTTIPVGIIASLRDNSKMLMRYCIKIDHLMNFNRIMKHCDHLNM